MSIVLKINKLSSHTRQESLENIGGRVDTLDKKSVVLKIS
jgi:hypothetical protein